MGATHAEKSTTKAGALNAVPSSSGAADTLAEAPGAEPKFCAIDDPTCEACQ
jgi:ribonucleoside-diphosphate reductase alpha chain